MEPLSDYFVNETEGTLQNNIWETNANVTFLRVQDKNEFEICFYCENDDVIDDNGSTLC